MIGARKGMVSPWAVTLIVVAVSVVICAMAWQKAGQYRAELKACADNTRVQVDMEKKKVVADLEDQYRADRISYQVMARRLERQNNAMRSPGLDVK